MEPFRYHVFVCDQRKAEGAPCCSARGSGEVIEALRHETGVQGLAHQVQITSCGSLGLCERGPNMVVYPEGVWYSGVERKDVPEIVRSHFKEGRAVERLLSGDVKALYEEILSNRNKARAAMEAKEASGELPDDLAQTLRGFQESRVLLTAIELDVFGALQDGAPAQEVAAQIGADPRATEMLLNALVAMGMLVKSAGVFQTRGVTAMYFGGRSGEDARAAALHTAHLWHRWSTLTDCVRAGTSLTRREERGPKDDWTEAFIAAMHRNARARAPRVVEALDLKGARRMLDVGGGSGAYSIAFARSSEKLEVELLDLAEVVPIAERHIREASLAHQIKTRVGDLRTDPLGADFDLILLSAVCHMLGPGDNRDLLLRCHAALAPGGRVVIADFILDDDKTAPRQAALFALNMLVGTRDGSSYAESDYGPWLREAGFSAVDRIRLPGPVHLMVGTRSLLGRANEASS